MPSPSPPPVPSAHAVADRAELHFHVLPGVDDGPRTLEETVALARLAVADGTAIVVATPHFGWIDTAELAGRVAEVAARLAAEDVALEVRPGAELSPDDVADATDADLARIAQGPAGKRWLLLEAPLPHTRVSGHDFADAAADLRRRGYGVLIGHPERSPALVGAADVLEEELAAGSVLQVNASSLVGAHTEADRERGLALVHRGVVGVVASDAHGAGRPPRLTPARAVLLAAGVPAPVVAELFDVAPRAVLEHGLDARAALADR